MTLLINLNCAFKVLTKFEKGHKNKRDFVEFFVKI